MIKKIVIASIVFVLIMVVGGGVYYISYKRPAKEAQSQKIDIKGWKTYVSKFGFSVSYPKEWTLIEEKEPRDIGAGYWPFNLYYEDNINKIYFGIDITGKNDFSLFMNKTRREQFLKMNVAEKIIYYLNELNAYNPKTFDGFDKIKIRGGEVYLYKYKDKKYNTTRALIYVSKTDAICDISFGATEDGKYIEDLRPYQEVFLNILRRIEIKDGT
jgi:hypothetical protein